MDSPWPDSLMNKLRNSLIQNLPFFRRNRGVAGDPYKFERVPLPDEAADYEITRIRNVLNYAKTGEASYSAHMYPAGYHTLTIDGVTLNGQRNPEQRLALSHLDFAGKSVLDLGCNQGGMLHQVADKLKWGVGLDYDARLINAANLIRDVNRTPDIGFYVFDLDADPLEMISDLLPEQRVDVVLLLSVCMWIEKWREVINFASRISDCMLFETNGKPLQQKEQEDYLSTIYRDVHLCSSSSEDDPRKKSRRLLLCRH